MIRGRPHRVRCKVNVVGESLELPGTVKVDGGVPWGKLNHQEFLPAAAVRIYRTTKNS